MHITLVKIITASNFGSHSSFARTDIITTTLGTKIAFNGQYVITVVNLASFKLMLEYLFETP